MPGLFDAIVDASVEPPTPEAYTSLDTTITKLKWILEYVEALATTAIPGESLKDVEAEFLKRLGPQAWEELRRAREFLLQFKQGVLPSDIASEIRSGASIGIEGPMSVQPERPATFRVKFFGRDDLTLCSACEEVKPFWDFGDGLRAQGWEVSHFYRRASLVRQPLSRFLLARNMPITVTFQDERGRSIGEGESAGKDHQPRRIERVIQVKPDVVMLGTRTRLEAVWLLASLAVPFFGLLAGARQEFLKTDAMSGLIVVFLLGFGANHVKDLFKKAA